MCNSTAGLLAAGETSTPFRALIYLACTQRPDGGFYQNFWINGEAVLAGHPTGRGVVPHHAGLAAARSPGAGELRSLADGEPGDALPDPPRPGHAAGTLGGEQRLLALDAGGQHRRPDLRRRLRPHPRRRAHRRLPGGIRRLPRKQHREMDRDHRWGAGARGFAGTTSAFIRWTSTTRSPTRTPTTVWCRSAIGRPGLRPISPPRTWWTAAAWNWCDGIRKPGDPIIEDTLRVIDATLKVDTPFGPCWRATPTTVTARRATARLPGLGQGPGLAAVDRRARPLRIGGGPAGAAVLPRWKRLPRRRRCCPSRSGTSRTGRRPSCISESRRGPPCPCCGPTPSTCAWCVRGGWPGLRSRPRGGQAPSRRHPPRHRRVLEVQSPGALDPGRQDAARPDGDAVPPALDQQ